MAEMTWDTLTGEKTVNGSIRRWINYDPIDPEEVIAEAEDWMAMFLRVRDMQVRITGTRNFVLATGDSGWPIDERLAADGLPEFLDPLMFFIAGHGYLRYVAQDEIDRMRWPDPPADLSGATTEAPLIAQGCPTCYAIVGNTLIFDCACDQDYLLLGHYFGRPPALSENNQTNIYTTKLRKIFKEVLLGCAYDSLKDNNQQSFHIQQALALIQQKKTNDDLYLRAQEFDVRVS